MAARLSMWLGNIRGNVRNKPSILIVPIAVFIGCVLGSILGTYYAALSQESNAKTTAQSLAVSVTSTFQQRFESTLAPIVAINGIIKLNPNYTQLEPYLTEFISSQLIPLSSSSSSSASSSPSFQYIEVDPMLIGGIQLPTTFNGQPAPWLRNRNLDFLSVPLVLKRWPIVMSNWPNNTMFGPSPLVAGGIGVAVDVAVFVNKSYDLKDPSYGLPWRQAFANNVSAWPVGDPEGQLWGAIILAIDFHAVINGTDPDLNILPANGYKYALWQDGKYSVLLDPNVSRVDITPNLQSQGVSSKENPVTVSFNIIAGNTWYLDIIPNEGTWRPAWMLPVIIILPIVSLFIAALILVWLVDQESHMRLLRALIPADMMTLGGSTSGSSNQLMAGGVFGADLLRSSRLERSESSAVEDEDVIMDRRSRTLILPGVTSASRAISGKQGSNRLQSKPSGMVAVQTPAERILNMVGQLLQNKMPHIEDILAVREAMSKGVDIHQAPIGFERALEMRLDKDVAASLLALVDDRPTMGSGRNNVKKRNIRHTSALTPVDEDSSVRQHHHLEGTQRLLLGGAEVQHTDLRNQDASAPHNVRTIIAASVSDSAMLKRQHEDLLNIQNLNLNDGQQKVDVANMTASMIGLSHDGPQATLPSSYAGCGTSNTASLSPMNACQQATLAGEGVQIAQSQIEGGNYDASSHKVLLEDGHNNSDQVLSFSVPTLSVIKVPAVASAQAQALLSMLRPESLSEEPKLLSLLEAACNNWSFDTFKLQDATWGHALSMLSFYILTVDTDIADALDLNKQVLANFLAAIEALYCTSNPYHCGVHGADVLQMYALLVKRVMKPRRYVDSPVVHLACIIAAVVHDVDHKGVNNDFLINSKDPLALLYNDESPMEAYHCSVTFKILYQKDCNFISHLQEADQKLFRHLVIKLVLATDMKQHFSIVSRFCAQHRLGPTPSADKLAKGIVFKKVQVAPEGLPPVDEAERLLSLQMALKISDLRATGLPVEVGQEWVLRLEEELFKQGDRERALGLPVSPLSDRNKPESGVSKAQPGFYEFIVLPLAYNFMHVFPEIRDGPMHGFRQAYHAWRRLAAKGGGDSGGDMTLRSSVDGNDDDLTDSPAPVLHHIHNRSDSRVPSSSSAAESKTSLPPSLRNSNAKSGDESNMQKRDLTHPSGKAEGSAVDGFNDEGRLKMVIRDQHSVSSSPRTGDIALTNSRS